MKESADNFNSKWYKEPWPWIIIAMLVVTIIACSILISLAVINKNDLVVDNYYQEGKHIALQMKEDEQSQKLGIEAQIFIQEDKKGMLLLLKGNYDKTKAITVTFFHTRAENDKKYIISPAENAPLNDNSQNFVSYSVDFKEALPLANHWDIQIEDENRKWRLKSRWFTQKGNVITVPKHPKN